MIISAPSFGPMIAGFSALNVNTRRSGSRWGATESALERVRAAPGKSSGWPKMKRRAAQGAGNTSNRATRPASLPVKPKRREGQAVSKLRASFYATAARLAVTNAGLAVTNLTVSVADRA